MFKLIHEMSKYSQIFLNKAEKIFWQSTLKCVNYKSNTIPLCKTLFSLFIAIIHFPKYHLITIGERTNCIYAVCLQKIKQIRFPTWCSPSVYQAVHGSVTSALLCEQGAVADPADLAQVVCFHRPPPVSLPLGCTHHRHLSSVG